MHRMRDRSDWSRETAIAVTPPIEGADERADLPPRHAGDPPRTLTARRARAAGAPADSASAPIPAQSDGVREKYWKIKPACLGAHPCAACDPRLPGSDQGVEGSRPAFPTGNPPDLLVGGSRTGGGGSRLRDRWTNRVPPALDQCARNGRRTLLWPNEELKLPGFPRIRRTADRSKKVSERMPSTSFTVALRAIPR